MRKISPLLSLLSLLCVLFIVNGCSFLNPFNWFGSDLEPGEKAESQIEKKTESSESISKEVKGERMKVVPDSVVASVEQLGKKYELYTVPVRVDSGDSFSWEGKFGVRSFRKKIFIIIDKKETLLYTFKKNQKKVWVILNIPRERVFVLDKKTSSLELYNLKGEKREWTETKKVSYYNINGNLFIVPDERSVLVYDKEKKIWVFTAP